MYSLNKIMLLGRLGANPEVRYTKAGDAVATLSIATSRRVRREGERGESVTDWHRAVCFKKKGEICRQYLSKGDQVMVEGRVQTSKWTDNEGKTRYTTEVVVEELFLLGGGRNRREEGRGNGVTAAPQDSAASEEVPF